ncbi:HPC2 and ubinuclein domain-containing protein [Phytophthora infestans]|uniref:HPC2 and ubinuclein domain-containing protein n=1 Tax=Phytophthora infestans TaxID=4787 RepID=A0A833WAH1_PHYIN|nr:HPC2 and ubinuclein domain-containing protein [Phytophthora infestans]KAF4149338.1 HPC2 and ubinuclein domain-containing protein [Phytophthora infestans]
MASAAPEVSASAAPKPRRTFHIQLDANSPAEINFKQLVVESARDSEPPTPGASPSNTVSDSTPSTVKAVPVSRPQRFNIIEHLEKRYGGGSVLNDGDDGDVGNGGLDRRDDDDLYDSEDSFIDDAELQQNIEDVRGQTRVKTKHSGFFVNAGDEIETLEKEEDELVDAKNKKGKKRAVDGALRSFLTEVPDAASDWQPEEEVVRKLEVLRTAVQELAETAPIPKVFPRSLDEPLRAVDKLVVEAHPNKWRVTGYFATLMTFLPYTKQYLKSNMLRLEARDVARHEREKLDAALEALTQLIATYGTRAAAESIDVVKTDIAKDKELGAKLHALLELQDEWVSKENDYRQMLKTEDKKHIKELDYKPLNQRQERNRMFNRILALFTPGLTDLQTLRALNKAAKAKTSKKPAQLKTPVKNATAAAKKKTLEPTNTGTALVKRSIKPFKSRMMDEVPLFVEDDFEEVEQ